MKKLILVLMVILSINLFAILMAIIIKINIITIIIILNITLAIVSALMVIPKKFIPLCPVRLFISFSTPIPQFIYTLQTVYHHLNKYFYILNYLFLL